MVYDGIIKLDHIFPGHSLPPHTVLPFVILGKWKLLECGICDNCDGESYTFRHQHINNTWLNMSIRSDCGPKFYCGPISLILLKKLRR